MATLAQIQAAARAAQAMQREVNEILHTHTVAQDWPQADFYSFYQVQGVIRARPEDGYPKDQLLHFVVYAADGDQAKEKAKAHCKQHQWGRLIRMRHSRLFWKDGGDVQLMAVEE